MQKKEKEISQKTLFALLKNRQERKRM